MGRAARAAGAGPRRTRQHRRRRRRAARDHDRRPAGDRSIEVIGTLATAATSVAFAHGTRHGYHGHMKQARIAELKNNLSRYVARVRAGETITVLDRNKPVARLVPIAKADRKAAMDARLIELERKGWLRRGTGGVPKV